MAAVDSSSGGLLRRARVGAALALAAGVVSVGPGPVAGVADAQTSPPAAVTVSMKRFAFAPASVTVAAGGTVTWTYDEVATDPNPNCESVVFQLPAPILNCPGHSTTADQQSGGKPLWDSGVKRAGGFPFTVTLTQPGTFTYKCTVHATSPFGAMVGRITVAAAPSPSVSAPSGSSGAPAPALAPKNTPPAPAGRAASASSGDPAVLAVSGGDAPAGLAGAGLAAALVIRRLRRRGR